MLVSNLTEDVFLRIVELLDVQTIVLLSMTCKSAAKLIMEDNARSIWTRLLRRISLEEYLAPHSFPEDSIATQELISICTRPMRLQHNIRKQETLVSSATELELLCQPINTYADDARSVHLGGDGSQSVGGSWSLTGRGKLFLCPGGRWLIGPAGNEAEGTLGLLCWDILQSSASDDSGAKKRVSVAQATCQGRWSGRGPELLCCHGGAGSKSAAVVLKYSESLRISNYEVMVLTWSDDPRDPPTIQSLGFTQVDDPLENEYPISEYQIDGDIICITRLQPAVIIWNWRTNQRVQVSIPELGNSPYRGSLWVRHSTIVIVGANFTMWKAWLYAIPEDLTLLEGTNMRPVVVHEIPTDRTDTDLFQYSVRFHHATCVDSWIPASERTKAFYCLLTTPRMQIQINASILELNEDNVPSLVGIAHSGSEIIPLFDHSRNVLYSLQTFLHGPSGGTFMQADSYMYDLTIRKDYRSSIRTPLRQIEWRDEYTEGHIILTSVTPAFCPRSGSVMVTQPRTGHTAIALIKFA